MSRLHGPLTEKSFLLACSNFSVLRKVKRVLGTEADYDTGVPNSSTMGVSGVSYIDSCENINGPMRKRWELGASGLTNVIVMSNDDMMVHKQPWDAEDCSCDQGFGQRQRV